MVFYLERLSLLRVEYWGRVWEDRNNAEEEQEQMVV